MSLSSPAIPHVTPGSSGPPWKVAPGFSTDWPSVEVASRQLAPHIYFLHGSGGNSIASAGPDGVLLIDPEFAPVAPKLKRALAGISAGPVRMILNTHFHPDHAGGNAAFRRDGALIVAQTNTRTRLLEPQYSYFWARWQAPAASEDAPALTFENDLTLHFNGEEIQLFHRGPAHSDADAIIYFRRSNIIHMGDVFLGGLYPYIDVHARGTIDGYFPVIDDVLRRIDGDTQVVPGHGPVSDRSGLEAYRNMLQTVRDRVACDIAEGASLEQIIASGPSAEFDVIYASNQVGPEGFVAMVYQSLTGERLDWQPDKAAPPPGSSANQESAK